VGWFIFTLTVIVLILLINVIPIFPQVLWSILLGVIYLTTVFIISRKIEFSLGLITQKFLGEMAQTAGFIKGARCRKEIEKRRLAAVRGIVFMLAGVPLDDTGGGSRGAQISLELIRQGYAVVYLHQYPKLEKQDLHLRLAHPNLFQMPFSKFDLDIFLKKHPAIAGHPNKIGIIEFPLPAYLPLVKRLRSIGGTVLYDSIDDWQSTLGWDWYSYEDEVNLIQECDLLTATVPNLAQRLQQISHKPVELIPNAVNDRMFDPEVQYLRPRDLPESRRVIMYSGALWGDWFDWELLGIIAQANPSAIVCVIGDYRGQYKDPPLNLKFLGLKAQNELPAYLAYADVAIIPWKVSQITQSTSPLKVYEYLAMGLPVVAPDLEPLKDLPGVYLAKNHADFLRLIDVSESVKENKTELKEFVKHNNWESRVRQLISILESDQSKT
jgi:glycosyltransferase involved in cell wall biosynthesis